MTTDKKIWCLPLCWCRFLCAYSGLYPAWSQAAVRVHLSTRTELAEGTRRKLWNVCWSLTNCICSIENYWSWTHEFPEECFALLFVTFKKLRNKWRLSKLPFFKKPHLGVDQPSILRTIERSLLKVLLAFITMSCFNIYIFLTPDSTPL